MAAKKVDRSDAAIFRALKRAAKSMRGDNESGHRVSHSYWPNRCARCNDNWPCSAERKARNFDKLAKAVASRGM